MKLKSSPLGQKIKIKKKNIISFEKGLYGFEKIKEYVLLDAQHSPYKWLCAVNDEVCFMVIDPKTVEPEYKFRTENVLAKIGANDIGDLNIFCLVVMSNNIQNITVNLKSPIVINKKNNKAIQLILNKDDYELRYKLKYEKLDK